MDDQEELRLEYMRWKAAQPTKPTLSDILETGDRRLFIGALAEAARNATAEAVERQERVSRVRDTAIEAYGGDAEAAERFLRRKHLMLGDVTPLQVAAESAEGADRVIQLIGRVQYGGSV